MKDKKLSIVITADPEIPVPPLYYGGIERIVDMLVSGLVERGHEVHLFAHPESNTPAKLIPYRGKRSGSLRDTLFNALQLRGYIKKIGSVDIIHSFSRLAYLFLLMKSPIPKIQSYQRDITPSSIRMGILLAGENLTFTACSKYCANTADFTGGRWVIIPNGVKIAKYQFVPYVAADAPLVFLGRVERIKGAHIAIEVAKRTGQHLLIAGNYTPCGRNYEYFTREILPHCDGGNIQYIGPVNDMQKNELLGKASAMLFPVEVDEPFGIVMVEALACGTPVIAFGRGAVEEVIQHGSNGFICNSINEMIESVRQIPSLERINCRRQVEERFCDRVIVEQYEQLYYDCLRKEQNSLKWKKRIMPKKSPLLY